MKLSRTKSRRFSQLSTLAALAVIAAFAAPAAAQIDSDPTNNTTSGGDVLTLATGAAVSNLAELVGDGNDVDFFNVALSTNNVLLGMTTPIDELPYTLLYPDTMVSVIRAGIQRTFSDDDDAATLSPDEDFSHGSLFRYRASAASTVSIGVTAYGDYEFDGATSGGEHEDFGQYILTAGRVNPNTLGGGFADTDPTNNVTTGANTVTIGASGAVVAVANLLANDIDYYKLTLAAGDILSVLTAPTADLPTSFDIPDTLLGLYDSTGALLVESDDAGDFGLSDLNPDIGSDFPDDGGIYGSAIRAIIPSAGTYYLRVEDLDGTQVGRYAMLIGVYASGLVPVTSGDFNEDGDIDAADYVMWRKLEGNPYDELDYEDWYKYFGESGGTGGDDASANNVPEPTATCLLITIVVSASVARACRSCHLSAG